MPRNLYSRVEVVFPVEDPSLKTRIIEEVLQRQLEDNTKAWLLQSDASYKKLTATEDSKCNSQLDFMELASPTTRKRTVRQQARQKIGLRRAAAPKRSKTAK
jgi:polyphosphate kinase